ncbi:hypothetical protein FACS189479_05160 [Spirochaetia bacterium]|nr:hypothetical protein FACS189479_05160 [Spirochaetia bacterium]
MKNCVLKVSLFFTLQAVLLAAVSCSTPTNTPANNGSPAPGYGYYVSALYGSDSNNGDSGHPFKTISKAASLARAGTTVIVREGVYRERVSPEWGGREGAPVVYQAEQRGKVIIKGSDVYTGSWEPEGGLFTADLDDPDNGLSFTDDVYWDNANPFKVDAHGRPDGYTYTAPNGPGEGTYTLGQVFVGGKPYKQVVFQNLAQAEQGTWWFDKDTNKVHVNFKPGDDKDTSLIEFTTRRRIFAPHKQRLGYITVDGFIMEHCGNQYPLYFWEGSTKAQAGALGLRNGHHWTVKNNVVRYAAGIGLDCGGEGQGYGSERNDSPSAYWVTLWNVIEDNYFIDNGASGVAGWGVWNMVFKGNVVMHNNRRRYSASMEEHAGVKFHEATDSLIANNYIAENYHYGMWIDNKYNHSRVTGNVIYRNHHIGLDFEMGQYNPGTALVDRNIILNNGNNNTYNQDGSGVMFLNNLIGRAAVSDAWDANDVDQFGIGFDHVPSAGSHIWSVTNRTPADNNAYYNNMYVNNTGHPSGPHSGEKAHFTVPYPLETSTYTRRGQRFLGNLYTDGGTWNISAATYSPAMSQAELESAVAGKLGVAPSAITFFAPPNGEGRDYAAQLTLPQWNTFWADFWQAEANPTFFNDSDAQVLNGVTAAYNSATQTLSLNLPSVPAKVDNSRWDTVYKDQRVFTKPFFGANPFNGDVVYPGPFQTLTSGNNTWTWSGLPPAAEDELPRGFRP